MKIRFFKIIALLVFVSGIVFSSCKNNSSGISNGNYNGSSNGTSDEAYKLAGDWTVLVYFCGSDLETNGASATENIAEMTDANFENKKVIFQTGGATKWHFDESEDKFWYKIENGEEKYLEESYNIPSDKIGRYRAGKDKIEIIEELDGENEICKKSTITDFVKWGLETYPSKHTALVFWNHGGGAVGGYGQDENNGNANISIKEIGEALKEAGLEKKFDFIGFDTCLMGCYEVAVMASSYAEKLIASEEVEGSGGWDWTETINALEWSDYYKRIINAFAEKSEEKGDNEYTLSCIDLRESKINALKKKINYFVNKYPVTNKQNVKKLVAALEKANEFGVGAKIAFHKEMFDIGNIFSAMGESINLPVLYKKNGKAHSNATGLSIYFPYCYRSKVNEYSEKVGDAFSTYNAYITSYVNYCTSLAVNLAEVFDNDSKMELDEDDNIKFSINANFQAERFKNLQVALFSVDDDENENTEKLSFFGLDQPEYTLYSDGSVEMSVPKSWICFSDSGSDNFVCAMISNIADDNISYLIPAKMNDNDGEKEIILSAVLGEDGLLLNGFYNDEDDEENSSKVSQRLMPVPNNAQIKFLKPIAVDMSNIDDSGLDITSSTEYYDKSIPYSNDMLSFKRFSEGSFMSFVCVSDIKDEIHLNTEYFVMYGIEDDEMEITVVSTNGASSE